jgi:hypothetical protein
MSPSCIGAVIFIVIAVICLIAAICFKSEFYSRLKKFYIATAGVYLSGTFLILFVCLNNVDIPLPIALVSEVFMMVIFGMSVFTLTYVGKKADDIKREAQKNS